MRKPDRPKSSQIFRCAIYTRKSSDEGLEQEFNSLDAQREACEAFIVSQRHAGWIALPDMYDDGGLSGGTMERPALQRLLSDIEGGKVQSRNDRGRYPRGLGYFDRLATRLIGSFSL
jgi:site-specific DNA recombinase